MAPKQKLCFHPLIIAHWRLEPIAPLVRETAEFVNLHSAWRGSNRFVALLRTFDMLRRRPEVADAASAIPALSDLRAFVGSGVPLGHPELRKAAKSTGSRELADVLAWSEAVNRKVAVTVRSVRPFEWARASLEAIARGSDAICVSQTPAEALIREWEENDLLPYVRIIAGQEIGTKSDHLALAAHGKYAGDKILMIGDALGDLAAARSNNALFFPIPPDQEEAAWKRFHDDIYGRFLSGRYAGECETGCIAEFERLLPETPPWGETSSGA